MNTWSNTVLTDKGLALMAKLTQGNTLNITKATTGAGYVTPGLLSKQTAVADPKQTLSFKPVSYPETGKCVLPVEMTNEGLVTGYTATQVGIYAADPDEGEILFFISQAADAEKGTSIPSETEMPGYAAEWTFYLAYGQADKIEVTVDQAGAVPRAEFEERMKNCATLGADGKVPEEQLPDTTYIPVTSEVPSDSDIWIDPDDESIEEAHVKDRNNPHGVTPAQIGAMAAGGYWVTANSASDLDNIKRNGAFRLSSPVGINNRSVDMLVCFEAYAGDCYVQLGVGWDGYTQVRSYWYGTWNDWLVIS